jgi:glycosyltransferase involved in cell wall biosynthesis
VRILHIISNLGMGGAESLLCEHIRILHAQGIENDVLYFHDGILLSEVKKYAKEVRQIKGLVSLYDPFFFVRLWVSIRELNPDCIHTWLWAANFTGRIIGSLLKIPVLCSLHNNVDQNGSMRVFLDRLTWNYAHQYVAVSQGIIASLEEQNIPTKKVKVIYNGIDYNRIFRAAQTTMIDRAMIGLAPENFVFGSVGRFVPLKNYSLLLQSFALVVKRMPKARLVLIGMGPQEQELRQLANDLNVGDTVIFIVGQRAQPYYQLFDCFVMSSFKEGISMALLEALANAKSCIITNPTKYHEVISDGIDGVVINSYEPEIVAHAMLKLMENPLLLKKYGQNGCAKITAQFSLTAMVTHYCTLYNELIAYKKI